MVRAVQVTRDDDDVSTGFVDVPETELGEGDVLVDVAFSSLNYKDALALRGDRGVARVSPLIPGIDLVGTVAESDDARWRPGDEVVLTGAGLGETRNGGYARRARVSGELLIRVPAALGMRRAAAIGTAGFTAGQSVLALDDRGIPDGDVLVTGATGGVGSVAVMLLSAGGRTVAAATGDPAGADYLRGLGASTIIDRTELQQSGRPLQSARWAGAVDVVGGSTLATLLAQTRHGGAVAACGLVEDPQLHTTVMPFILRGVALLGINSVEADAAERARVWDLLERRIDVDRLDALTTTIPLNDVVERAADILTGRNRGRFVVEVGD
ncbi:MDR family oxidoreductase [Homoserinibacter sp. GY 40078]|uniref:MDR family oxidoreductase n=1 Tax=Homoserinibacter sp. GY 40078 TaxID=2603275 RepID=UPI0011C90EFB|nr:MDR family oxidoreductase [Homoserinibacter sp. GY 40078]TXK18813.1 oxidoreductase [Homoserinibacter sp. GY 40078]